MELILKVGRFLREMCEKYTSRGCPNTGKCLDRNESLRITKIKFETLEGSVKKEKMGENKKERGEHRV